jgi:hypothetical protein
LRERIPDPLRAAAQAIREYRNSIVHRRQRAPTAEQSFREVLAELVEAARVWLFAAAFSEVSCGHISPAAKRNPASLELSGVVGSP